MKLLEKKCGETLRYWYGQLFLDGLPKHKKEKDKLRSGITSRY
jgi:hypothetical protein